MENLGSTGSSYRVAPAIAAASETTQFKPDRRRDLNGTLADHVGFGMSTTPQGGVLRASWINRDDCALFAFSIPDGRRRDVAADARRGDWHGQVGERAVERRN